MRYFVSAASLLAFIVLLTDVCAADWPRWRGPNDNGLIDSGNPPIEWSETKNVRWKAAVPGLGHATPIVWGDRIFLQTAVKVQNEGVITDAVYHFRVYALDRKTGKTLWEKTLRESSPADDSHHETASYASSSGLTDGETLFAYFGSHGLYALDLDGNLKWEVDFGDMRTARSFGEGSSPALHGDKLIVNWDHEGDSFIVALDKTTGKELWRQSRDEGTTWGTPYILTHNGQDQVILGASGKIRSYDPEDGSLLWECAGLGSNVIPMPVHQDGVVYVASGHRQPAMLAIQLDKAKGDITGTDAVLWSIAENTPYVSSPILYGGRLYFVKNRNAILSSYDPKTGEPVFGPTRLKGMGPIYSSLIGVGDRIYISDLDGNTLVIKNSAQFEELAMNKLDEGIAASPVAIGDELFIRGHGHLYCIATASN